jgi:hypothetical protein
LKKEKIQTDIWLTPVRKLAKGPQESTILIDLVSLKSIDKGFGAKIIRGEKLSVVSSWNLGFDIEV